jgi:uncharacterized protein (TIGR03437 family)
MRRQLHQSSCASLALLMLLAAPAGAQVTITVGSTVTGSLTTKSAASMRRPGAYAAYYFLQGAAGQPVAISLSSTQFDTYLYLVGPSGVVVSEDDDNGTSSDSRIPAGTGTFSLLETGVYTVEATSFSTNTFGAYTLTVEGPCVQPPPAVVRFDTLDYITEPDANGVRLLAGQMSSVRLQQIGAGVRNLPLPAFPGQKFCGVIDVAPEVKAEVFVPTSEERFGNYSRSGPVLWDPATRRTLADGTVVMDPFPNSIVPMFRLQPAGLFAWRLGKVVTAPTVTAPSAPAITKVVNAFGENPTISSNTWMMIKGTNLASNTRIWVSSDFVNNRMPTALDGISVTMSGRNAYVYYISTNQVNVLTPSDLALGPVQVQVSNNGAVGATFTVQAQQYSPSFFVFDGTHVTGTHADGSLLGPPSLYPGFSTPAKPNESLILYANGFGPTSSPVVNGDVVQSGSLPVLPVISIGGIAATVQFAGLVSPGLYQFNVVVPASAQSGENALTAAYSGLTTQAGVHLTVEDVPH